MSTHRRTPPPPASRRPFGAVGTAMVTPFTPDGDRLDLDAAQAVAAHLVAHGQDMLVVSGTTGESPTTSDAEKLELVRVVREAVGDEVSLVAGVGTNDTRHSVELARRTAELPVDGLLVVTPYYSRPSQEGILAHVEAIASASELPLMLYDIPVRSGVPLEAETILRLAEVEHVAAVKDAKGDILQATMIMDRTDLAYYSGEDAANLPWLAVGAGGIVSVVGHAAPDLEAALVAAVDRGDLAAARDLNARLAPVVEAIMTRMPGAVAAKTALHLQGLLPHAAMRGPLLAATPEQTRALAQALEAVQGIPPITNTPWRTR